LMLGLVVWFLFKVFQGLYLSPISRISGPKLAAITHLNEFYHVCIRNHWGTYLRSLHGRYGPIVRINPNEVHILDHDFNYIHFNQRNLDKEKWYFQLAPRSTATITPHAEHRRRRDIILPLFNGRQLRWFETSSLSSYLTKLDAHLGRFAKSKEPLNLTHLFWAASNDILAEYIFGTGMGLLDRDDLAAGYDHRTFNATRLASVFRQWPLSLLLVVRNVSLTAELNKPFFSPSRPRKSGKSSGGIAQHLYSNHKLYRDSSVLNPECAEFMLGGTEAITYNLAHVFHGLMGNPTVARKLRKELDSVEVPQGRIWDDPRVVNLKYLVCLFLAKPFSYRLNDTDAIRFVRQSHETVAYKGFTTPPRTTISMTEMFVNWDSTIFPEPEKFDPDRWLSKSPEADRARKLAVTFGLGNRTCVAKDLVMSIMTRIVATAVSRYDVAFWDEGEKDGWGMGYLRLFP
ncbi:cytochrome P450, partial [Pseudomassariella vexata]